MKNLIRILVAATVLTIAPQLSAAISVDSMNYPVWAERGSNTLPLAPGDRLRNGDVVVTGDYGRVWLAADDGSVIKLGQGARFQIERAEIANQDGNGIFDAAFDVLRGAFRFTSSFFTVRREVPHQADFKVGAVTVGVRGTDIWGRSAADEDFVALIEGSIEVASEGDAPQRMEQPLTLYRKAAGQPADGIVPVVPEVVGELALETELSQSAGIAGVDGDYQLVLASARSAIFDAAELEPFRRAGYPVRTDIAEVGGVQYTRIVLDGLVDRQAATNLRRVLVNEFSIDDIWIRNSG